LSTANPKSRHRPLRKVVPKLYPSSLVSLPFVFQHLSIRTMSADPLDDLRVSVDSHTLDATSGKRRLRAIEPDGTLTYEDP
jgi:hypothetical protein